MNCSSPRSINKESCSSASGIYLIDSKENSFALLYYSENIVPHNSADKTNQAAKCNEPMTIQCIGNDSDELVRATPNLATIRISKDSLKVVRFAIFHLTRSDNELLSHSFFINNNEAPLLDINSLTTNDLLLIPDAEQKADIIDFSLFALRINYKTRERSFFPSSEELRVEITNSKGASIWLSNENMNYLTVIGDVKPSNIADTYKYNIIKNLKAKDSKTITKGIYKINYTLPIVPRPYFINFDLYLE